MPLQRFMPRLQPLLLGLGFALLIAISGATVGLVNRAAENDRLLAETSAVQDKLAALLLAVRRAESAKRGYLFSGDESYLDEYRESEPEAKRLIDELRASTTNNSYREDLLARVDALIDAKFKEMSETIDLNRKGDRLGALNRVKEGREQAMMGALRKMIEAAIAEEGRLAQVRSEESRTTNYKLLLVTLVGAALIVVIGALSMLLVQRNARQREQARQELEGTNANLERIVAFRTEDLVEANEEIQRFAYIVSHDLRSPLVNIMGFTSELEALRNDLLEQLKSLTREIDALKVKSSEADGSEGAAEEVAIEQLATDFDEALGFIKSSTANMDRLINAVLTLSREGRREFHPEPVDINDLVGSLVEAAAHRIAELEASIDVHDLPAVQSDRLALQQIFSNLIDNALKYRRPNVPLQVEISGEATASHAIYKIKDNGRGIDPRDHQRVFELFRRSGPLDQPGEGIGLAHVRALVRRLGGNMGLSSELDHGSVFTVTLPKRWSADNRKAA